MKEYTLKCKNCGEIFQHRVDLNTTALTRSTDFDKEHIECQHCRKIRSYTQDDVVTEGSKTTQKAVENPYYNKKQFWTETAKRLITEPDVQITESASKQERLILWLWGIYTPVIGFGSIGLSYFTASSFSPLLKIIFFTPCITLIIAYFCSVMAQSSEKLNSFNMDNPADIEQKFKDAIQKKESKYNIAQNLILFSIAFITISFFLIALQNKPKPKNEFKAVWQKEKIHIRAKITGSSRADLYLNKKPFKSYPVLKDGIIQDTIEYKPADQKSIELQLIWSQKAKISGLSQKLQ